MKDSAPRFVTGGFDELNTCELATVLYKLCGAILWLSFPDVRLLTYVTWSDTYELRLAATSDYYVALRDGLMFLGFFSFPYMLLELLFLFLDLPLEGFDSPFEVGGYKLEIAWTWF